MKCSICGKEITKKDSKYKYDNGEWICNDCMLHKCRYCCQCGSYHLKWNACRCTTSQYSGRDSNSYGTKPPLIFFSKMIRKLPRYYGMEFELSYTNPRLLKRLYSDLYAENYIYNKQDGSLNDGIEIVTQPMDREFMDKFLDMLGDKIDKIKEFSSGDTSRNAGIHIHTTRDKIPKDIQRKIHLLFNYCFDMENVKYLSFLVGRRKTIKAEHDNMGYCACGCGNMTRQAGRHEAVNFNNEDTIEFRMFKSTLNIEQIKSYFDIVDLSIEFCDKTPISYININNFLYYIKKNSNNKLLLKKIKSIEKDKAVELSIEKNEITTVNPFKDMDTDKLYRMYNACDFRNRRKVELVLKQKLIDDILKQQSEVVECA